MARISSSSASLFMALALALCGVALSTTVGCSQVPEDEGSASVIKLGLFTRGDDGYNDGNNIALALLALREINAAGGLTIDGEKYTFDLETAEFTDTSPGGASEVFDELVEKGVKAVLGPPWSSQVLDSAGNEDGVWRRARERETVMITQSATNSLISDLDDDGYVYGMMPPDRIQGKIAAQEAYARGFRNVSILRRDDAYASGLAAEFAREFEALGGAIGADHQYDTSGGEIPDLYEHDYTVELDAVFATEPDLVYLLSFDELVRISQRISERGDVETLPSGDVQFLAADGLYDIGTLQGCATVVVERLIGTTPGSDGASTVYQEFSETLAREGLGEPWRASSQLYDAAYLIALAMQSAGSFEPSVFREHIGPVSKDDEGDVVVYLDDFARAREALLSGEGVNYDGASGPIEFNATGQPSFGTYLVWRVRMSESEGLTLVTEKLIPFRQ